MINEEQYNKLLTYERQLHTAYYNDYVIFNSYDHKKGLAELYNEIKNKKSGIMQGCGRCALRDTKELAELFFEYKEKKEKKENAKGKTKSRKNKDTIQNK